MSDVTASWWKSLSGEILSEDEMIARLQRFFTDNGEAIYGKPPCEGGKSETKGGFAPKIITLQKSPFTIPLSYETTLPDLQIVPMWAGKEIEWRIVDQK